MVFPLNHDQCGAIPEELGDINPIDRSPTDPLGDRVAQLTTTAEADGSRQIERIDLVTGIAQDSNGDRYIWTYENHPVYDVPPGDDPVNVSVRMFDRFRLMGNGFNMEFSFDSRWDFQVPSGSAFDPGSEFTGVVFLTTVLIRQMSLIIRSLASKESPAAIRSSRRFRRGGLSVR